MRNKPIYHSRTIVEAYVSENDGETPLCAICSEHVGEHTDAMLMLRGQFFYMKNEGYSMFVLDPDTKLQFIELPDALGPGQPQYALVINTPSPEPIVPAHAECVTDELSIDDDDDEEVLPPDDHLDEMSQEMHDAMERDFDRDLEGVEWDKDDNMIVRRD
jgi:hypothetical protein